MREEELHTRIDVPCLGPTPASLRYNQ